MKRYHCREHSGFDEIILFARLNFNSNLDEKLKKSEERRLLDFREIVKDVTVEDIAGLMISFCSQD